MSLQKHNARREFVQKALSSPSGKIQTPHFFLLYKKDPSLKNPLFTCVVSKKVAKKAVERNTIKRQCRELITPHLINLPDSIIGVVTVRKSILSLTKKDINTEIDSLFNECTTRLLKNKTLR